MKSNSYVPLDPETIEHARQMDLLSYATYLGYEGKDYKAYNLLSLSGVYQPKKEVMDSKIGRICTQALTELLKKDYK